MTMEDPSCEEFKKEGTCALFYYYEQLS
ncbi:unnamed protein product [Linum tenue]|uniref:Uncharacterized protein n=1 Tax=Linum tenue TaxID=586396 RepID=A0AAV0MMC8_9ROSI|nr:unnamed protein product [Linum tenue]